LKNLCIVGDQAAALRGALGPRTRHPAHRRDRLHRHGTRPERIERAGGFGHLVGDEGSGYALGKIFLAETIKCLDGQRDPGPLTRAVVEVLDHSDPVARIMDLFYGVPFDKSRIARYAVVMDQLLEAGDPETLAIAKREAGSLLTLVRTLPRRSAART